ncbi:histone deacetylase [candidate division KSB1 bacterium]
MKTKTAYVFDPVFLKHNKEDHPENAQRLIAIIDELTRTGLDKNLHHCPGRVASIEELESIHHIEHISDVMEISKQENAYLDPDTYTNSFTWEAAFTASGSLIQLTNDVIENKYQNGFALLRPPGHHAMPGKGMGFCIFNNIAIAAQFAKKKKSIDRIAIIDFDIHHGNGTQASFEEDPDVLYVSSHSYPFYPGTGNMIETGSGKGLGSTVNMPLSAGTGDDELKTLYEEFLPLVLNRFQPQLILVSAGYDAHWCDPFGNLNLSLDFYSWISKLLVDLAKEHCNGKIIFTLEGGYHTKALAIGVINSLRILSNIKGIEDPLGKNSQTGKILPAGYIEALKKLHKL